MKKMIIAALLVVSGATTASADPLMKYTYADVAYQWTHIDISGINDSNGLDSKLSYAVMDNVALEGGYNYVNSGITGANVNINQSTYRYGVAGWHTFCNDMDLVGRVGGTHVSVDSSGGDSSDNGVYAGATLRTLLAGDIEGNADILYDSANSLTNPSGAGWTYGVSALKAVAENVAIKVGASIDLETDVALTAGVRLTM
jgi:hypothetical protein